MNVLRSALQVVVALTLLSVWLLRFNRPTPNRGGGARSMKEEFAAYGLPIWSCYLIGALKVGSAAALLVGLWVSSLRLPAAALVSVLMAGAIFMHVRIGDPGRKSVPALIIFLLALSLCTLSLQ